MTRRPAAPQVLANSLTVLKTGEWMLPFWREKHNLPGVCDTAQNSRWARAGVGSLPLETPRPRRPHPPPSAALPLLPVPPWTALAGGQSLLTQCAPCRSAGVLISEDGGASWQSYGRLQAPGTWLIEGSLVQLRDESLLMLFRTTKVGPHQAHNGGTPPPGSRFQAAWGHARLTLPGGVEGDRRTASNDDG